VSCKAARKLARYGSVKGRRIAGWKQTSYASGHAGSRLVTRDDSRGEVHFYRVPTDPYMQAIWRKGQARIVVGSGGCDGMC
jgi:hypothetical protein